MSAALRIMLAAPLLAALAASAGHAATNCPGVGTKAWKEARARGPEGRVPAVKDDCQRDCKAAREAKPETPSPLPLSVVTRAEEVADWHADIFERLSSQQGDDRSARYCGLGSRSAHRQL